MPTPPTDIYTLSLHDALPISSNSSMPSSRPIGARAQACRAIASAARLHSTRRPPDLTEFKRAAEAIALRSEEHTSELQSLRHLVCRLLLEKKKKKKKKYTRK